MFEYRGEFTDGLPVYRCTGCALCQLTPSPHREAPAADPRALLLDVPDEAFADQNRKINDLLMRGPQ